MRRMRLASVAALVGLCVVAVCGWGGAGLAWAQGASPATAPAAAATGPATATASATQAIPELDAAFVSMKVPKTLKVGEVFRAEIVMRNTGSLAWKPIWRQQGTETVLLSQDPQDNKTWGTSYIIQGQGTEVAPGRDFKYVSGLQAPAKPGAYTFQWRVKARGSCFGQPTPAAPITVEPLGETEPAPAALPPPDADGKRVLTFDDFEYVGSFRVPARAGAAGSGFSAVGLAFRKVEGTRRLLMNYTHPAQVLFEIDVPEPIKLADKNVAVLPMPEVKKLWGQVHIDVPKTGDVSGISPNGGLFWDEPTKTLYWSWHHWYWTGGPLPVLAASKLGDDGALTHVGPWQAPNQKHHWGGVVGLSEGFARKYTDGRRLALGFGGYYNVCGPCSRGPALGAIAVPDPAKKEVDLLPMVGYAGKAKAPRDGDYFSANCGYWDEPPEAPWRGWWAAFDECRAGVFIDLPKQHAYIALPRLVTGRIGYDYGSGSMGGSAEWWYFYNPADLGAAAKGDKKPAEVLPYLRYKELSSANGLGPAILGGQATGVCFDPEQRRLYVVRTGAYPVDKEVHPLVHVYQVK